MGKENLVHDTLDEVQQYYNRFGFSRFSEYREEISTHLIGKYNDAGEIDRVLRLIESELNEWNSHSDTRLFSMDSSFKLYLVRRVIEADRIIGYIEEGVVVDHIPLGKVWGTARILGVDKNPKGRVSLVDGCESKKTRGEKKGILKVEGRVLSDNELNLVALVAPDAMINVIKDGKVVSKREATIPEKLEDLIKCPNPRCVSNIETEHVTSIFYYNDGFFSCYYCERKFQEEEIVPANILHQIT